MTATPRANGPATKPRAVGPHFWHGLFQFTCRVFLTVFLAGLLVAGVQAHRSPMADLEARLADSNAPATQVRDLLEEMRHVLADGDSPLVFSQSDLNRYVATTLQGDLIGPLVADRSVENPVTIHFELRPGACDIHLQAAAKWFNICLMLSCEIERHDAIYKVRMHHGQVGRLPLYGGFLAPGLPAFRSLAESFAPELEALFRMSRIELLDNEVRLHSPKAAARGN